MVVNLSHRALATLRIIEVQKRYFIASRPLIEKCWHNDNNLHYPIRRMLSSPMGATFLWLSAHVSSFKTTEVAARLDNVQKCL